MKSSKDMIIRYFLQEIDVINKLRIDDINKVFGVLDDCLHNGRRVYIFGNGGSGSTATHMTNDFNNALFKETDKTFDFYCLNDNIPTMMAIGNDLEYADIFLYQLIGRLKKDDVVIAISGSGNSENIVRAVTYARDCGAVVVGFTGYDGGKLKQIADYTIDSNVPNMEISEDIHMILDHLLISTFFEKYGRAEKKVKKLSLKNERRD